MEGQIQIYLIILLKDFESALHYDHDNKETSVADFSTVRVVEKIDCNWLLCTIVFIHVSKPCVVCCLCLPRYTCTVPLSHLTIIATLMD